MSALTWYKTKSNKILAMFMPGAGSELALLIDFEAKTVKAFEGTEWDMSVYPDHVSLYSFEGEEIEKKIDVMSHNELTLLQLTELLSK